MPIWLAVIQLFGGVAYLLLGADLLVRGAIALARKLGVPTMVIGLTVVAFGTSAPELVVSVRATLHGYSGLAIANVVGSNTANILLVVALPSLIHPLACNQPGVRRDAFFVLGTSALFFGLCWLGPLGRGDGFILLAGLAFFLAYLARASGLRGAWTERSREIPRVLGLPTRPAMIALLIGFGALALPLGAELLIDGAVGLAETLRVPNALIGLTVVALGTSLPELATTTVAAFKHQADVAVGNVLGSNVMNVYAIMGLAALVSPGPMQIPRRLLVIDLPVMLAATLALALVVTRRDAVGRTTGLLLAGGYVAYVALVFGGPA